MSSSKGIFVQTRTRSNVGLVIKVVTYSHQAFVADSNFLTKEWGSQGEF